MSYWVQVVVATPAHSAIAGPLTYRSKLPLSAGTLVRVPLGKREVMGVVWDMAPTLVASRTALPPEGVELRLGRPGASFVAPTLVASRTALPPEGALRLRPGEAGSAAPAGVVMAPTLVASRTALPPEGALRLRPGEAGSAAPAEGCGDEPALLAVARALAAANAASESEEAVSPWGEPTAKIRPVASVLDDLDPLSATWRKLVAFTAAYYQRSLGEVALAALPPQLRDLSTLQLARRLKRKTVDTSSPQKTTNSVALSNQQARALAEFDADSRPALLFGATGSGKTEVYLQAAARVLAQDPSAQVLVMVPEINLTPQLQARFEARFAHLGKERVVPMHSGLTPAQRLKGWLAAHSGQARLVLGTRMAVFASMPNLRLLVVDEEHDPSYKQQEGARYSARDLAVYRARLESLANEDQSKVQFSDRPSPHPPAGAVEPALPDRRRSAPLGGSAVREATSVGAIITPAGAAEPALPDRRRSAPPGGSEPHEVGSVGACSSTPAGAVEPALPGHRRSAPSGGSEPHEVGSVGAKTCRVLLGSATPSLESWQATLTGKYQRLDMEQRIGDDSALPTVRRVDMNHQPKHCVIAPPLLAAIAERVARGEQSLIFLNRRGYAPVLACHDCDWKSECPHCSAYRVFHKIDRTLRCHHCGFTERVPRACPACGNIDIAPVGRGTERLEEHLSELLAGVRRPDGSAVRVARIDADSTRLKGALEAQLASVHAGEVDVLVGTQMIAKGHDFRHITLVAAINPDGALFSSDFRAPERLFGLLMQAGGRAGRDARHSASSEMWVQTFHPGHPLFEALKRHDYPGFATRQLAERKAAGLSPFGFSALLRAEAKTQEVAQGFLNAAAQAAQARELTGHTLVTPYPAVPMTIQRVANIERAQMLVESPSRKALQAFLAAWQPLLFETRRQAGFKSLVRWAIDVDPMAI